jgi:hypothetical protein
VWEYNLLAVEIIWSVVGVVVALLIGTGINVLGYTPPEFKLARACFWCSAIILGLTDTTWHLQTDWLLLEQMCVAVPLWGCILIGLPAGTRWIDRRETAYISLFTNPAASTKLFDGTGKEIRYDRPSHNLSTSRGRMGYAAIVIVTVIVSGIITGRFYRKRLKVPTLVWEQPRKGIFAPPSFAYDHTPNPSPLPEHPRAYLHVDDVAIEIEQTGLEKKYPVNVIAHIRGHNVSVFTATCPNPIVQASISFRPFIPPEHVAEEQDLFIHGLWANEAYLGYKHVLNPLELFGFSKRRSLIADDPNPFSFDAWKKIASGEYVIYVVTRAIYSDKWGKLPEEQSCSTFSAKDNFRRGICWGQYQQ